jgi:hypothetical protein
MRLRDTTSLGLDGSLLLAAVFLGLNFVAIKIAVVSIPPLSPEPSRGTTHP